MTYSCVLMADIGGTNVRFAYLKEELSKIKSYKRTLFASFEEAVEAYIAQTAIIPQKIVLGVAGIVKNDKVALTNGDWVIDKKALEQMFPDTKIFLVNDFVLQGYGVLSHKKEDFNLLYPAKNEHSNPLGLVIGAGTGLGCCLFLKDSEKALVFPTEAGHNTLSALTNNQKRIKNHFSLKEHISFEYLASGSGLTNLYNAVKVCNEKPTPDWEKEKQVLLQHLSPLLKNTDSTKAPEEKDLSGEEIVLQAKNNEETALLTLWYFFEFLGIFTGNMALSVRAESGIYFVGALLNDAYIKKFMTHSLFYHFYARKGRFQEYLKNIPLFLAPQKDIAFSGLVFLAKTL